MSLLKLILFLSIFSFNSYAISIDYTKINANCFTNPNFIGSNYCTCIQTSTEKWIKDFKNIFDFLFADKEPIFQNKDICAQENLDPYLYAVNYKENFERYLSPLLSHRIDDTFNVSMKILGGDRWQNLFICMQDIITYKCSKSLSLLQSFSCIKKSTNIYILDSTFKSCLTLFEDENSINI